MCHENSLALRKFHWNTSKRMFADKRGRMIVIHRYFQCARGPQPNIMLSGNSLLCQQVVTITYRPTFRRMLRSNCNFHVEHRVSYYSFLTRNHLWTDNAAAYQALGSPPLLCLVVQRSNFLLVCILTGTPFNFIAHGNFG